MGNKIIKIDNLMIKSGVVFGTSGARGLVSNMTDEVCYAYSVAFLQYLEEKREINEGCKIAIGGDLRCSTDRIMKACAKAVEDKGYKVENCGKLPSPALANYGFVKKIPTIMVTGSHIPDDRNGIKYTKMESEFLKHDESGMIKQTVVIPEQNFDINGKLAVEPVSFDPEPYAINLYISRYTDFFPGNSLKGKKIVVYQHSAVGRDLLVKILSDLGATVIPLGISDTFIPVDTEAIRIEDVEMGKKWAKEYNFDSIVSTDGDSDRPLISDEYGQWLRGDVAGILCSSYFKADSVITPVSSNSAIDKSGRFKKVYYTKIGSPYVIETMLKAKEEGSKCIVGYEANGGFLLGSDITCSNKVLKALPTRDAVILIIAILLLSKEKGKKISELVKELPKRFTFSDRLKNFPTQRSNAKIAELFSSDDPENYSKLEAIFGKLFGRVVSVNTTDGLRISFETDEVVHLRPSGNAPEFRCYNEANAEERVIEMNKSCIKIMEGWR